MAAPAGTQADIIAIVVIVVLAAAGRGVGIWLATRKSSTAAALTVTTETVSITTGTMQQTVAASGTIQPGETADLNFGVSGQVTSVKVAAGDKVTKGETLATIGSSALQAQLDSAKATLTAAQAKQATDVASGTATTSQLDSDQASVTSASTQVTTAQTNLTDATLKSTITGTVAAVNLTVGQVVSGSGSGSSGSGSSGASSAGSSSNSSASSSSSTSSSAQITVIDTNSYTVSATVDDTEVAQVKPGDQAVITPASSTTPVYGTVSSVGMIASSGSGVAAFPVVIAVTGTPSGLYAGATATVSIITVQLNNVVEVPTAAITYSGGKATVVAVTGGKHVTTAITTGVSSGGETQVVSGLSAGAKVVERVVKFNATAGGGARSLFGGTGTGTGRTFGGGGLGGGFGGGGFGGGGTGGGVTRSVGG